MTEREREMMREALRVAADALADTLYQASATMRVVPGEAVIQWYVRDGQLRVAVHLTRLTVHGGGRGVENS